jgi:hypothetical protein
MVRIEWDQRERDVNRLVVRRGLPSDLLAEVRRVALAGGLFIVTSEATPQPGDFWIGCSPDNGWGEADPEMVAWAGVFDLEAALDTLWAASSELELVG